MAYTSINDPYKQQATVTQPGTITPTQSTSTTYSPYSMDWTKNLSAFYAKPWGGAEGTEQAWYRTPEWAGGVVWNPYYGWQSGDAVKELYSQGQLTPEQFYALELTRNPGEDWTQYYQQLTGMTPEQGKAKQAANYAAQQAGNPDYSTGDWAATPVEAAATPTAEEVAPATGEDMLARFGYTGQIGINPYEQMALDFINQYSQGGGPLATMEPAQSYYGDVLAGKYAPEGEAYRQQVYESTKAGAMQNLEDLQKKTAEQFANMGGYFGGQHSLQQALLQQRTANDLANTLANLNLEGYNQNLQNMTSAAQGLTGMATSQQDIVNSMLSNIMSGGEMLTEREMTNRAEYQNAQQRVYEDWLRAREESLQPYNWALSLLGLDTGENVVSQSQNAWGSLLGGLGQGAGSTLASLLGG